MSFTNLYNEKLVSADQAADIVKSGDWIDYGWTVTTPVDVDAAIAKKILEKDLYDLNFRGGILMWEPEIFKIHGI